MQKQLRVLLAGAMVVVPFAITAWVIVSVGQWLDDLVSLPLKAWDVYVPPGLGVLAVLVTLYVVGLATQFWIFRVLLQALDALMVRIPGVKTVYESVRDLLKLFGGDTQRMGRTVLYTPGGTELTMLAILTNDSPAALAGESEPKVAIYLPYSYMFGGITVYVPRSRVREIDVPVEQALKLCATAQVGGPTGPPREEGPSKA